MLEKNKLFFLVSLIFVGCLNMFVEPSKTKREPQRPFVVLEINPDDTCMVCLEPAKERVKEGRLYRTDCCHNFLCEADWNELLQNYSNTLDKLHNIRNNPLMKQNYIDRAMQNNELLSDPMVKWLTEDIEPLLTCPVCREPLSTHQAKLKLAQSQVSPQATARYEGSDFDADLAAALELSKQSFVKSPTQTNIPPRATALPTSATPPQATARSQSPVSRAGRPLESPVNYYDDEAILQAALDASLLTEQPRARVRPEEELQAAIEQSLRSHAAEQRTQSNRRQLWQGFTGLVPLESKSMYDIARFPKAQ